MKSNNVTDMTQGSALGHIVKFAVPLLIGNLFQQLYNMVDSIVVGKFVGEDSLAAVGTCSSSNFLFFSLSSGVSIGIGIIISQYFGAKDEKRVRNTIGNSFLVMTVMALLVSIVGYATAPALMHILNAPDNIFNEAVTYLRTTCLGIVAIALYNGIAAILRALGDSKTPLYFLIVSSVVNVALDLIFVLNLGMGVFGVALATIIAQLVSALAAITYAFIKIPYFRLTKEELKPNKEIIINSIKIGAPVAFQNSTIAISCMALQGVVNTFGSTVMAAFTVTSRIEQVVQQPYGSLGMALTTYAGQNMGAGRLDRVKDGFKKATLIAFVFSMCLIPIAYLFGRNIVGFFVNDPEVIRIASQALRINSLCYFGLGMIYVPRAMLNGCGDTGFALINGFIEVTCRFVYAPLFTRMPKLGFWGIWVTTGLTWVTTAVVCVARYLTGKWKTKAIT